MQFRILNIELCQLSLFSFSCSTRKKRFLLLGIKFRGHTKEETRQQPATCMNFLTREKNTLKIIPAFYLLTFVNPQPVSQL